MMNDDNTDGEGKLPEGQPAKGPDTAEDGSAGASEAQREATDDKFEDELESAADSPEPTEDYDVDDEDGPPASPSDRRREKRRRQRAMEAACKALGLDDPEQIKLMNLLDELLPDTQQMIKGEDVAERFERALETFKESRSGLLFDRRKSAPLDLSSDVARSGNDRTLLDLSGSEEELYKAVVVNEQALGAIECKLQEHLSARQILLAEIMRRATLAEQWRYMLPKWMLPICSMLEAAGADSRNARPDAALFNALRDALLDWADGNITRERLLKAAKRTEDEFLDVLRAEADEPDWEAGRERLKRALAEAKAGHKESNAMEPDGCSEKDLGDAERKVEWLEALHGIGAGLTAKGTVIAPSIEALFGLQSATSRQADPGLSEAPNADASGTDAGLSRSAEGRADPANGEAGLGTSETMDEPVEQSATHGEMGRKRRGETIQASGDASPSAPNMPASLGAGERSASLSDGEAAEPRNYAPDDVSEPQTEPYKDLPSQHFDPSRDPQPGLIFSPAWVKEWPQEKLDLEVMLEHLPRGQGLSRSTSKLDNDAFGGFTRSIAPAPYSFMALRKQVDLSSVPVKGPIDPRFWARFEVSSGRWQVSMVRGPSPIFGQPRIEMLPPHADLAWYASLLSWPQNRVHLLTDFGDLTQPGSLSPRGAPHLLVDVFVKAAKISLQRLVAAAPGHYLAMDDARGTSERKIALAAKHLARWWIFVLLVRHDQELFRSSFTGNFFLGVEGPDFVLDANGNTHFGTQADCSHFVIHDDRGLKHAYAAVWEEPISSNSGVPGRTLEEIG